LINNPDNSNPSDGKRRLFKTIGYSLSFISLGLTTGITGPTLPDLANHTRVGLDEVSILLAAKSLGYLIGTLLGGGLFDRVPGHPVFVITLSTVAAGTILVPEIPVLWVLSGLGVIVSMGEGIVDVGGNTLLLWVHGRKVGPYMNALHFTFGLGAFISPIIVARVLFLGSSFEWAYRVLPIFMLPAILWLLRVPSPRIRPKQKVDQGAARNHLLIVFITMFLFLYVGAEIGFGAWITSYARVSELTSDVNAAVLTSVFWGALTLGRLISIPLATRIRPRITLLINLIGCLGSMGAIFLWPESLPVVWVGTFTFGLFMASIFPTTLSLAERRMEVTGRITSVFIVGGGLGAMSLPWFIGQVLDAIGPRAVIASVLITLVVAFAVYIGLMFYSARYHVNDEQ
jgi:FHS family Na+ dependent glucose MFS transporter 1